MARTRQPQGNARIDWANPYVKDLRFAWTGSIPSRNIVTNVSLTPVNGPTTVANKNGLSTKFDRTSSQYLSAGSGTQLQFSTDLSVLFRYRQIAIPSLGTASGIFSRDTDVGRSYTTDINNATSPNRGLRIYSNGGGGGGLILTEDRDPAIGDDRTACLIWSYSTNTSQIWVDGALIASGSAASAFPDHPTVETRIGARQYPGYEDYADIELTYLYAFGRRLGAQEVVSLSSNPWQLFAPQRRLWIQLGAAAGGGIVTESATGRLRAKASETSAPIRTQSVVGKRKARGSVTDTAIHTEAVVGKRKARGAATAAPATRTEASVGRVKARATTAYTHISAGQITESIAGRSKARAAVTTTPIRTEAVVARRQARGSDTVTLTRAEVAVGRSKLRAGVTAAPLVAGMITEAAVGRLRARGSSAATSALRVEAVASRRETRGTATINGIRAALAAGRARLRAASASAPYVAPTLPAEVPASSRILIDKTERLGASPAPRKPPRLG